MWGGIGELPAAKCTRDAAAAVAPAALRLPPATAMAPAAVELAGAVAAVVWRTS